MMHRLAALMFAVLAVGACDLFDGDDDGAGSAERATRDDDHGDEPPAPDDAATETPEPAKIVLAPAPPVPQPPLGLPDPPVSRSNPITPEKRALGRLLFFDQRLSGNQQKACASCHAPDTGWTDSVARARVVSGKPNLRRTHSLINVRYQREYFWDGRVRQLETALLAHWKGQLGAEPNQVAALLATSPVYVAHFERAFDGEPTASRVVDALSAFVRTIYSGSSAWDRYEAGETDAVGEGAIAGFALFTGRAQCANCHVPPLYTDRSYHHLGVGDAAGVPDPGRAIVTRREDDEGAFKTPTLRAAPLLERYFHDGSAESLAAAVRAHYAAIQPPPGFPPVTLTTEEEQQLLAFLEALAPGNLPSPYPRPKVPADE